MLISNINYLEPQQDQLDNNLPLAPYKSKLAKLNVECSDPYLLKDCIEGQKWKCVNDNGRWRKHKCKFHVQLQDHLAQVNKLLSAQQNKRNCACFTPNGVVYTKIKSDKDWFPHTKRDESDHQGTVFGARHRRDISNNEVFMENSPPELIDLIKIDRATSNLKALILNQTTSEHSRNKRESIDHITSVMDELHAVLESIETKFNNQSLESNETGKCFVETTGRVNCSNVIYEDQKAWKKSRVQIDLLIKVLKNKINNLKYIKQHLKENRPPSVKDEEDEFENTSNASSMEDIIGSDEIIYEEPVKQNKRKHKRPHNSHRHNHHSDKKRKHKGHNESEDGTLIDMSFYTTESDPENFSLDSTVELSTETPHRTTTLFTSSTSLKTPHQRHRHRNKTSSSKSPIWTSQPEVSSTQEATTTESDRRSSNKDYEVHGEDGDFSSITPPSTSDLDFNEGNYIQT